MKILPTVRIVEPNLTETERVKKRQDIIRGEFKDLPDLFNIDRLPESAGQKNCENWIGSVVLPVGVVGPLGMIFEGQTSCHYLPLATTEGALVASVSRGSKAVCHAGGARVMVKKMGMSRAPVFACTSGEAAFELAKFIDENVDELKRLSEGTSGHLKYLAHQSWVRGKHLYVRFVFDTDEAMGMNMVTIASQAISDWLEEKFPDIKLIALSSNACSDKKDNFINVVLGRGYWSQAEVWLSPEVIKNVLKTTPQKLVTTHLQKNLIGSNVAGSLSQNAQVANVLAGIFLATGQDPAHVVEGSKAFLFANEESGGVYVSLTLPNLNLGTIGGGTCLPAQKAARELLGMGELKTKELVALTAVACLAGEISLLAALSEKSLAQAHQSLAR